MRIEEKANGKIREDAQVEEYEMDRADAEERFGGGLNIRSLSHPGAHHEAPYLPPSKLERQRLQKGTHGEDRRDWLPEDREE
jgi:hypothetical protein